MSGAGIALTGTDELVAACQAVSAVVTDPAAAETAAGLVADRARPNVPRVTGFLQSSEQVTATSTGALLEWLAPYALAVHARRPWIPAAEAAAEAEILDYYEGRVAAVWT